MTLAFRLFWRDWRSGELRILFAALLIAISVVTGVASFAERLQRGITERSATFLAGDLVVRSRWAFPQPWIEQASDSGLKTSTMIRFPTMGHFKDRMQLVAVSAVSETYPLLGEVHVTRRVGTAGRHVAHGPPVGSIWVDPRVMTLLNAKFGDLIGIGETSLRIDAILLGEPDAASSLFAIGPRLMMRTEDLPLTRVIQPGSRVQYQLALAGSKRNIQSFRAWVQPRLGVSQKVVGLEDGQPGLGHTVNRVRQYLLLTACLAVILAGVAIAMASQRFAERHTDYVAILKTLGLSGSRVAVIYLSNFLALGVLAIVIGWILGIAVQKGILYAVSQLIAGDVPQAGVNAMWLGAATGVTCLLSFALPPLIPMLRALPLRVLRRDYERVSAGLLLYLVGAAAIGALMLYYTEDLKLTAVVLTSVCFCLVIVGGGAWLALRYGQLLGTHAASSWRLAWAGLRRHLALNAMQIVAFAVTLMLLLVLSVLRGRLLEDWSLSLDDGRPNHFLMNIADWERPAVKKWFSDNGLTDAGLYPMVPGRVVEKNGAPLRITGSERVNLGRDFNLSWSLARPSDNRLRAGRWWTQATGNELSVEASLAEALDLQINDSLTLDVAGERIIGRISSVRELDWDSMRPNFYVLTQPSLLRDRPATWITSFYLPPADKALLVDFARRFPTITIIEMDALLERARFISGQASLAVQLVLGVALLAGTLVLFASVQSGLDARYLENAILRTLGARRKLLLRSLTLEFAAIGTVAGVLAAMGAELASFLIHNRLLELEYRTSPWVWVAGPLLGAALVATLGILACRRAVDSTPVDVLRNL